MDFFVYICNFCFQFTCASVSSAALFLSLGVAPVAAAPAAAAPAEATLGEPAPFGGGLVTPGMGLRVDCRTTKMSDKPAKAAIMPMPPLHRSTNGTIFRKPLNVHCSMQSPSFLPSLGRRLPSRCRAARVWSVPPGPGRAAGGRRWTWRRRRQGRQTGWATGRQARLHGEEEEEEEKGSEAYLE